MTEPEVYDEGRIYIGYRDAGPRPGSCCASVSSAGSMMSHQCGNTTKVKRLVQRRDSFFTPEDGPAVEREYCGIHDPVKVAEKRAKLKVITDAKSAELNAEWNHKAAKYAFEQACVAAIKEIAAGHNDAMTLAREVMEGKPEL